MKRIGLFLLLFGCAKTEPTPPHTTGATALNAVNTGAGSTEMPLREWMRANAGPAVKTTDFARMADVYARIGEIAPDDAAAAGFEDWRAIATKGRAAAQSRDLEGVRAACVRCHDAYRASYKAQLRARPLPPPSKARVSEP